MPDRNWGRTAFGDVNILPPLEFDLSEGRTLPDRLGQTDAPVNVLSAWVINPNESRTPVVGQVRATEPPRNVAVGGGVALKLTFQVKAGATAESIAADLKLAFDELSAYEISLGGAGLVERDSTADAGGVRLVLVPRHPAGASDRLQHLADELNGGTTPAGVVPDRSFVSCAAEVTRTA